MSKRASIFEDPVDLDVASFAPKRGRDETAPPPDQVRAVTEAADFRSREAAASSKVTGRPKRIYRTGRNVQLAVKASRETVDLFYAITEAQGWVLGYTLERAIEALRRELEGDRQA